VANYIDYVRAARPVDPDTPVMIPGDPERKAKKARLQDGLPLPTETWNSIVNAGVDLGLERQTLEDIANAKPMPTE
jgi:hydroxycarboxylate dehydrogenase B